MNQIIIKTLENKNIALEVDDDDLIKTIKYKIKKIPFDCQRLIFNNQQLEDYNSIKYYDIQNNSLINLVLYLKGGASEKKKSTRVLPPSFKAAQVVNEKIIKDVGCDRKYWFGLIKYVNTLRIQAKKEVDDEKDFESVNKVIMDLFNQDLKSKGKNKILKMIKYFAEEAKQERQARMKKK